MGKQFVVVVFFDTEDTCSDSKKYSSEILIRLFVSKGADQHMHSYSLIKCMFGAFILSYMHWYGHPNKFEANATKQVQIPEWKTIEMQLKMSEVY